METDVWKQQLKRLKRQCITVYIFYNIGILNKD